MQLKSLRTVQWRNVEDGHFEFSPGDGAECRAQGERQLRWLGQRRRLFGSSFAAPHISAMVALLLERFPGSDLARIRQLLARYALPGPA